MSELKIAVLLPWYNEAGAIDKRAELRLRNITVFQIDLSQVSKNISLAIQFSNSNHGTISILS